MVWLGFVLGRAFGWTPLESIFTGALLAISSTTIIAKAFDEQGVTGRLRELVVGDPDLRGPDRGAADGDAHRGRHRLRALAREPRRHDRPAAALPGRADRRRLMVVPRAVRAITKLGRPETTLVASVGFCFAVALLASWFGYSVALGAFIAGSLVAESGEQKQIEELIGPVQDIFAAIFFVSVGMLIDPALMLRTRDGDRRAHARGDRRQDQRRQHRRLPHRQRHATLAPGGHEPRADRRVLVHHRRARPRARRDGVVPLPGRGRRLGDHHAHDAVADPRVRDRSRISSIANCRSRCRPSSRSTARGSSACARRRAARRRAPRVRRWIALLLVDMTILVAVTIGTSLLLDSLGPGDHRAHRRDAARSPSRWSSPRTC